MVWDSDMASFSPFGCFGPNLYCFCFRYRMNQGSFIWVIEEMNANGFLRALMYNGSIVFVIWARNSIGVA